MNGFPLPFGQTRFISAFPGLGRKAKGVSRRAPAVSLPAALLCLLSVFWLGGCDVWDALTRCRHEYTGYEVDSDGNRTDQYNYVCDRDEDVREIVVGTVLPRTGPSAETGRDMENGFRLAVEDINARSSLPGGMRIRLIFENDRSDPARAARAYERLIERDEVPVILGPSSSISTERIIPIAERNGVVAISPTSAAKGLGERSDYLFRVTLDVGRLSGAGVRITKEHLEYRDAATITNSADTFSRSSDEEITKALRENGVEVVSARTFSRNPEDPDFPDLTEHLRAVMDADPDILFISAQPLGQRSIIVQARRLGIRFPLVSSLLAVNEVEYANRQLAGSAEGAISFTNWSAASGTRLNSEFIRNYRTKYGEEPSAFSAAAYASVRILARAIADADGSTDSRSIRDALAEIRPLDTVLGRFSFDENGDAVYEPVVEIVKNGRFEVLGTR